VQFLTVVFLFTVVTSYPVRNIKYGICSICILLYNKIIHNEGIKYTTNNGNYRNLQMKLKNPFFFFFSNSLLKNLIPNSLLPTTGTEILGKVQMRSKDCNRPLDRKHGTLLFLMMTMVIK
jgi:hypothetical protein